MVEIKNHKVSPLKNLQKQKCFFVFCFKFKTPAPTVSPSTPTRKKGISGKETKVSQTTTRNMLIGLCGPSKGGKALVARFLVNEYGFRYVNTPAFLEPNCTADDVKKNLLHREQHAIPSQALVSQCWRSHINIVIRDIERDRKVIDALSGRPYFLMVYVDASISIRWLRTDSDGGATWLSFMLCDDEHRHSTSKTRKHKIKYRETVTTGSKKRLANGTRTGSDDHVKEVTVNGDGDGTTNPITPSSDQLTPPFEQPTCPSEQQPPECDAYSLRELERMSRLYILNNFETVDALDNHLRSLHFDCNIRDKYLRPSWDSYFMNLANLTSQRSNCMKRRVGCVIVKDRRIVSSGYNGTPSGVTNCFEGGCTRCNHLQARGTNLDLCLCLHAEENAIIEAGRERCVSSTLYSTLFPCMLCAKKIVQGGIKRVVFSTSYASKDDASEALLKAASIVVDRCYHSVQSS